LKKRSDVEEEEDEDEEEEEWGRIWKAAVFLSLE